LLRESPIRIPSPKQIVEGFPVENTGKSTTVRVTGFEPEQRERGSVNKRI
jgi:hypothetical protein